MKKLIMFSLGLTLFLSLVAVAQYGTPDTSKGDTMKSASLMGKISDDGKTFVSDKDGKSWMIDNPETVKGHEGHHVILNAHVDTAKGAVHVMSLKMAKDKMDSMQK